MLRFYFSWFINQVRNRSEMCEILLKTYKCKVGSAEAKGGWYS